MTEESVHTPEEMIEYLRRGQLTIIAYNETQEHILSNENSTLVRDIEDLVTQNQEMGGHELGFYFGNELFATGPTAGVGGIGSIHESLIDQATYVFANRTEARQDMTYMANMLSVLGSLTADSYLTFLANLPMEFIEFSDSIRKLAAYADKNSPSWREDYKFSEDDEEFATYSLHLQRVEPTLKRYLFRQLINCLLYTSPSPRDRG